MSCVCNQALFGKEEIHLYHIVPCKDDGEYSLKNMAPLHKICHETISYAKNPKDILF